MTTADVEISALNRLIETTIDSADGYEQAAAIADDADMAATLRRFGADRRKVVADLRAQVVALGGNPEDEGTLLAGAHRTFIRLKGMFGSSRQRVIEEVENGEDHIRSRYEDVLNEPLGAESRRVVEIAYGMVREGHDVFASIKHAYAG